MTDTGTSYFSCSSHSKVKRTQEHSVYHSVMHNNTQMTLECVRRCTDHNTQQHSTWTSQLRRSLTGADITMQWGCRVQCHVKPLQGFPSSLAACLLHSTTHEGFLCWYISSALSWVMLSTLAPLSLIFLVEMRQISCTVCLSLEGYWFASRGQGSWAALAGWGCLIIRTIGSTIS